MVVDSEGLDRLVVAVAPLEVLVVVVVDQVVSAALAVSVVDQVSAVATAAALVADQDQVWAAAVEEAALVVAAPAVAAFTRE